MKISRFSIVVLFVATVCGAVVYRALQARVHAATELSSFAPEGALLAIESPDFAGLLKSWTSSGEEQRWLNSADYAGFERSRLFSRLSEAQDEYTATAGLAADSRFLQQIAGGQSLLAWYDIGTLKFLYVTRMAPGDAEKTPLLTLRSKFEERKVGGSTFYVRTQERNDDGADGTSDGSSNQNGAKTVAFAVHGDYLLLATDQGLLANALQLMDKPADRTVQHEPWYANTVAAAGREAGDLRMTLNLAQIVDSPYFRTYWVQQNITEMKQYSAALSDLYREDGDFREERVMLAAKPESVGADVDLVPVLAYLPANSGVYRATAQPDTSVVLDALEDKLLSRRPSEYRDPHTAPTADLSTPTAGDAMSLEERIDEPLVAARSVSAELGGLRAQIDAAHTQAMLVYSATETAKAGDRATVFLPVHTAVVLQAGGAWNQAALQQALSSAIAARLTVGGSGLAWRPGKQGQTAWSELTGMQGLALAVQGKICVVASDEATMLRLMDAAHGPAKAAMVATTVVGFDHRSEREPFLRLIGLLDRTNYMPPSADGSAPPFFSGNMASLSNTFQDLDSETFTQTASGSQNASGGSVVHQTVVYRWRR
jgi:hypothetical protein